MSSNFVNQQNQYLHYSPLPPPFKSKSCLTHRSSRITSFCKIITIHYNYDPPFLNTTSKNLNITPSKTFLDPFLFALYHQEFYDFENIQDNQHFTLCFNYDNTRTLTFQPSYFHKDDLPMYNHFLHINLLQTPVCYRPWVWMFPASIFNCWPISLIARSFRRHYI